MKCLSKILEERHESLVLISLVLLASIPRLVALIVLIDSPGDGPIHAIIAYNWSRSPYLLFHGDWLPGFMYLSGIFSLVVSDPLVSTRILNLIIGILTIPLFYILIRRIFSRAAALFSSVMLSFLPLHITLSASSMTEASFLFEIFACMVLLLMALERTKRQALYLSLSLVCFCSALMTRYETWLLIPLLPSYYFWKTRRLSTASIILIILLVFPVTWLIGNYLYSGNPLPIFSAATKLSVHPKGDLRVGLFSAIRIIGDIAVSHIGWILVITILLGALLQLVQAIRGNTNAERVLYISMFCVFWAFMLYLTTARGRDLWPRYLLFGFMMGLPLAISPLIRYVNNNQRRLVLYLVIAVVSVGITYTLGFRHILRFPSSYITYKRPIEIKKVATWLQESSYCDEPIVLTVMSWHSTYLPLYLPDIGSRHLIVSSWTQDSGLEDFLISKHPSLLITKDEDRRFQARIETILKKKIHEQRLVHTEGEIKIYDIKPLFRDQDEQIPYEAMQKSGLQLKNWVKTWSLM